MALGYILKKYTVNFQPSNPITCTFDEAFPEVGVFIARFKVAYRLVNSSYFESFKDLCRRLRNTKNKKLPRKI